MTPEQVILPSAWSAFDESGELVDDRPKMIVAGLVWHQIREAGNAARVGSTGGQHGWAARVD